MGQTAREHSKISSNYGFHGGGWGEDIVYHRESKEVTLTPSEKEFTSENQPCKVDSTN